jgi:hypothetical protein
LVALAGGALLFAAAAGTVAADCSLPPALPQAIEEADAVFVGVVEQLTNGDRWAQVRVEDVWRGEVAAPLMEVRGGQDPETAAEDDRTYQFGTRYLFVLPLHEGRLIDNICTATTEWNEAMAELRPANAVSTIRPAEEAGSSSLAGLALAVLFAVGLGGAAVGVIGFIRRRNSAG